MTPDSPLIRQATTLMEQREKEPQHVRHVTRWSVFLFEKLTPLHQLSRDQLELLVAGALLHDIGWQTATEERPHHKESARMIREHPWKNITRSKTEFVALLARYHRKSTPSPTHRHHPENSSRHPSRRATSSLSLSSGLVEVTTLAPLASSMGSRITSRTTSFGTSFGAWGFRGVYFALGAPGSFFGRPGAALA